MVRSCWPWVPNVMDSAGSRIIDLMKLPWQRKSSTAQPNPAVKAAESALRLRRIFDETHDVSWRMLRRFGVSSAHLEDAFQQTYLIVSERLDDILPGRERSFVCGVALRIARSHGRRGWREVPEEEPDLRPSLQPEAEALLSQRRLVELCDQILDRLKPDLREVFVLHEIEGFSGVELASLLEIPEGTVHSRLRRARIQVRAAVETYRAEGSRPEVGRG